MYHISVLQVNELGCFLQIGKHETLKKAGGIYAELIRQQQREDKTSKTTSWGFWLDYLLGRLV